MKKLIALALTLAMIFALAACGAAPAAEETTATEETAAEEPAAAEEAAVEEEPAEKIPLKISHHPYFHALPSIYAGENGLYDCFDYTIDYYAGGPVQNEAIASGAWEVGSTGMGGVVLGIPTYNMKVLGVIQDEAVTIDAWCRSDSPLASCERDEAGVLGTAEDWKGLDILTATGTNSHLHLMNALEHLGLTEADVNVIDCASVPNIYTAFMAGEGDVCFVWAPYGYNFMNDDNYTKVCDISMFGVALPTLAVCTEEAYNSRPEVVQLWLEKFYNASDALMADTESSAELLNDFEEEQGIVMTLDTARMEFEYRPLCTLEQAKEYFEPREDGTSEIYDIIMNYAQFNLNLGKITQEDYDKMAEGDFVSDFILNIG